MGGTRLATVFKDLSPIVEKKLKEKIKLAEQGKYVEITLNAVHLATVAEHLFNRGVLVDIVKNGSLYTLKTKPRLGKIKPVPNITPPAYLKKRIPFILQDRVVWRFLKEHPDLFKAWIEKTRGMDDREKTMLLLFLKSRALNWASKHYPKFSNIKMIKSKRFRLNLYLSLRARYVLGNGRKQFGEDIKEFKLNYVQALAKVGKIKDAKCWRLLRMRLRAKNGESYLNEMETGLLTFFIEHNLSYTTLSKLIKKMDEWMEKGKVDRVIDYLYSIRSRRHAIAKQTNYEALLAMVWAAMFEEAIYNIPASFMLAIGLQESNLRARVHNRFGAVGPYQLTTFSATTLLYFSEVRKKFNRYVPFPVTTCIGSQAMAYSNIFVNTMRAAETLMIKAIELGIPISMLREPHRYEHRIKKILKAYHGVVGEDSNYVNPVLEITRRMRDEGLA